MSVKGRKSSDKARASLSAASRKRWDNPESKEREQYAELMRRSLHVRWHVKRGVVAEACGYCSESVQERESA